MGPRADRRKSALVDIPVPSGLYRRYIRFEWNFENGQVVDSMVAFELEIDENVYQVVRYDMAHGVFHRHQPDFPEPSPERVLLGDVEPNKRLAYARDEILENYADWETVVLKRVVLRIEGVEE